VKLIYTTTYQHRLYTGFQKKISLKNIMLDPDTKKCKLAELTTLKKELIALSKIGDKAAVDAKYAERKAKVAEFKVANQVQIRGRKQL